jgi:hypothetical protein
MSALCVQRAGGGGAGDRGLVPLGQRGSVGLLRQRGLIGLFRRGAHPIIGDRV